MHEQCATVAFEAFAARAETRSVWRFADGDLTDFGSRVFTHAVNGDAVVDDPVVIADAEVVDDRCAVVNLSYARCRKAVVPRSAIAKITPGHKGVGTGTQTEAETKTDRMVLVIEAKAGSVVRCWR